MDNTETPLDEETFDMQATRPPLTLGLPHTLTCTLLAVGIFGVVLYNTGNATDDLIADAILVGAVAMLWSAAKIMLRSDYHGWDIFTAWVLLDLRCLDTAEWGGAHLSSFPIRSVYRCGVRHET